MANVDAPRGLTPIRHRNGAPYTGSGNPYVVLSTYATTLGVGDPVIRVAGGSNTAKIDTTGGTFEIGTLANIEMATATTANYTTGVIVGFNELPNDLDKQYNAASTERIVYVEDDPDVIFEIQANGAIPAASIGLNANYIFTHATNTVTGRSGVELDTTGNPPATTATDQLRILRAVNRIDNDTTLTHAKVEVMINLHTERSGAGI